MSRHREEHVCRPSKNGEPPITGTVDITPAWFVHRAGKSDGREGC